MKFNLRARLTAEFLGSAFLVAAVIGSGIMGERLAGGNVAIALLANTIATGAALAALILTFGPISGAHLNPAVTLADAIEHGISWAEAVAYMLAQCAGGIAGAIIAHLMFGLHWYSISSRTRHGWALVLTEFVATFGLLSVIWGGSRLRSGVVPFAVASYITAACWFTASTSFANPAVTIARCLSDTFAGIQPVDVPLFIVAQLTGALAATFLFRWLIPNLPADARGSPGFALAPRSGVNGRLCAHFLALSAASRDLLNPLPPPCRRLERIREILSLVNDFAVAELHHAHGVCRPPLVDDCVFRDPEISVSENSPDVETGRLARMMTPQGLQIAASEDSLA